MTLPNTGKIYTHGVGNAHQPYSTYGRLVNTGDPFPRWHSELQTYLDSLNNPKIQHDNINVGYLEGRREAEFGGIADDETVTGDWTFPALTITGLVDMQSNGHFNVPLGTTGQRPSSPQEGDLRGNSSTNNLEYYDGTDWVDLTAGGGSSAFVDNVFTVEDDGNGDKKWAVECSGLSPLQTRVWTIRDFNMAPIGQSSISAVTDNAVARWDGTAGLVQNSLVTHSDTGDTKTPITDAFAINIANSTHAAGATDYALSLHYVTTTQTTDASPFDVDFAIFPTVGAYLVDIEVLAVTVDTEADSSIFTFRTHYHGDGVGTLTKFNDISSAPSIANGHIATTIAVATGVDGGLGLRVTLTGIAFVTINWTIRVTATRAFSQ